MGKHVGGMMMERLSGNVSAATPPLNSIYTRQVRRDRAESNL